MSVSPNQIVEDDNMSPIWKEKTFYPLEIDGFDW